MRGSGVERDLRRALSVPAPWALAVVAVAIALTATGGLAMLGSAPSSAASLSALPTLCGLLGALTVGADFRFGCLHTEVIALGGRIPYLLRSARAVATIGASIGAVSALAALVSAGLPSDPGTGLA